MKIPCDGSMRFLASRIGFLEFSQKAQGPRWNLWHRMATYLGKARNSDYRTHCFFETDDESSR